MFIHLNSIFRQVFSIQTYWVICEVVTKFLYERLLSCLCVECCALQGAMVVIPAIDLVGVSKEKWLSAPFVWTRYSPVITNLTPTLLKAVVIANVPQTKSATGPHGEDPTTFTQFSSSSCFYRKFGTYPRVCMTQYIDKETNILNCERQMTWTKTTMVYLNSLASICLEGNREKRHFNGADPRSGKETRRSLI